MQFARSGSGPIISSESVTFAWAKKARTWVVKVFRGSPIEREYFPRELKLVGDTLTLESHQISGAHGRAQANFSVRSRFFNAASASSASDLLVKQANKGVGAREFRPLPLQ
jgi:hypothetical protein